MAISYDLHIQEVEHSSFTPLVLSATGGMEHEANILHKRLASLLTNGGKIHMTLSLDG